MSSKWLLAIQRAVVDGAGEVPHGYKTATQLSAELRVSRCNVTRLLAKLIKRDLCDKMIIKVHCNSGHVRPVPHYNIKVKCK